MRRSLTVSLITASLAIAGCIWLTVAVHVNEPFGGERTTSFLWAGLDPERVYLILAAIAAVALFVAVLSGMSLAGRIPRAAPRRSLLAGLWVALIVGTPLALLHLVAAFFASDTSYTEIEGSARDLVVREWSFLYAGGGDVFERSGNTLTLVGSMMTDDGYMPFDEGTYRVEEAGGVTTLHWPMHSEGPIDMETELAPTSLH